MNFEIVPYIGVGPLRFGMTPEEVHAVVGTPLHTKQSTGKLREVYPFEASLVFNGPPNELRLVEVGFNRRCASLTYGGMNLFGAQQDAVLRRLLQDDSLVGEILGFLVFRGLGMTLTGFHAGPEEDLAVTVFERGRWDGKISMMKPFPKPQAVPQ